MEVLESPASRGVGLDTTAAKRLAEIDERKAELKEEIARLDNERGPLEATLLEQMGESGVSNLKVAGRTIYLHVQTWASVDRSEGEPSESAYERACGALRSAGLGDFVQTRFNVQSLSAYVRELGKDGKAIPAEFDGAIKVSDRFSVRSRKAS